MLCCLKWNESALGIVTRRAALWRRERSEYSPTRRRVDPIACGSRVTGANRAGGRPEGATIKGTKKMRIRL